MAVEKELQEFHVDEHDTIDSWVQMIFAARQGSWINLEPIIDEAIDQPVKTRRGVSGWFSAKGSDLPFVTLMAPDHRGRSPNPASLGLTHGAGPKVKAQLEELGYPIPSTWRTIEDNPRRGLVCLLPDDQDAAALVKTALTMAVALCPMELDGWWSAVRHLQR